MKWMTEYLIMVETNLTLKGKKMRYKSCENQNFVNFKQNSSRRLLNYSLWQCSRKSHLNRLIAMSHSIPNVSLLPLVKGIGKFLHNNKLNQFFYILQPFLPLSNCGSHSLLISFITLFKFYFKRIYMKIISSNQVKIQLEEKLSILTQMNIKTTHVVMAIFIKEMEFSNLNSSFSFRDSKSVI